MNQENNIFNKYICFEGLHGSGKSTQIKILKNVLIKEGYKVYVGKRCENLELKEALRKIYENKDYNKNELLKITKKICEEQYEKNDTLLRLKNEEIFICE